MKSAHLSRITYFRESSDDKTAFKSQEIPTSLCGGEGGHVVRRGVGDGLLHHSAIFYGPHCAECVSIARGKK